MEIHQLPDLAGLILRSLGSGFSPPQAGITSSSLLGRFAFAFKTIPTQVQKSTSSSFSNKTPLNNIQSKSFNQASSILRAVRHFLIPTGLPG